ncbi:hypothetical protein C8J30_105135 [Rhodobacter viridis]|uniref:Uncharacterized protein n=1 Tax=Rhodobacter viridis TaxID=1054202 RepID=A0A318TZG0_9RHOB|nr:hypothetical protein C8J30_105135 [Rhodobacter viridis]
MTALDLLMWAFRAFDVLWVLAAAWLVWNTL